jgi:hypothetical protein
VYVPGRRRPIEHPGTPRRPGETDEEYDERIRRKYADMAITFRSFRRWVDAGNDPADF